MRVIAGFILCLVVFPVFASSQSDLNQDFHGRPLQYVLETYRQGGYKLIYTDQLILADMTVTDYARNDSYIRQLRNILSQFQLQIEYNAQINAWYIKKQLPVKVKRKAERLILQSPSIEEVTVTASTYRINKISNASRKEVDPLHLELSPARGSDPIYIANNLPGLTTSGISAKPHIRGGDQNEILFEFDDIELLDPYHLKDFQNLISGVNASIIKSMDVYTGGFPAQYGGKMGGVIDLSTEEAPDDILALDANFLASSITVSDELNNENYRWLINFRRGNIEDALERTSPESGSPRFLDGHFKLDININDKYATEFGYLHIEDNVLLNNLESNSGESAHSRYLSQYYWLKLNLTHSPYNSSQWILTAIDIDNTRKGSTAILDSPEGSVGNLYDKRDFAITRLEYEQYNKLTPFSIVQFGTRLEYNKGSYTYQAKAQLGELATLLGNPNKFNKNLTATPRGTSGSLYLTYKYLPTPYLSIDSGIRYDQQDFYQESQNQLSPRISIQYTLTDNVNLKGSVGRFHQHQYINELDISNEKTAFYKAQKSDHYIIGMEYKGTKNGISLEAYEKRIQSPVIRNQNIFNVYSLLPELSTDYVMSDLDSTKAEGLEFLFEHTHDIHSRYWLSYEFSKVIDYKNGHSYFRQWGFTQMAKGGMLITRGNWSFSATSIWHNGWRTTRFPNHLSSLSEKIEYTPNDNSLPSYFTLDFRTSYTWSKSDSEIQVYLECYNLTNRSNIGGYSIEIIEDHEQDGYKVSKESERLLPLIINFGFTYSF